MSKPRLGAHVSTAGGLANAFARGAEIGCEALQIFVKSPNQWRAKPLASADASAFRVAHGEAGGLPVVAHAAYLINLAAPDPAILAKSRTGLADEVARGAAIGLDAVVVHPGAHLGRGVETALDAIAASLDVLVVDLPAEAPRILLELTAGQGSVVGHTLEQLAAIRARADCKQRLGFCLDTCHAFAGGYDLRTAEAVQSFVDQVESVLGLDLVGCVHLNDSEGDLGSRKDRHANIGAGEIGRDGFAYLLAEQRLAEIPMVLETPMGDDELGHARDLETLRGLL
jgi:deoxyribonuclease-4